MLLLKKKIAENGSGFLNIKFIYLSNRSATGSAYLASDAVNKTHSYISPIFRRNSSTKGRFNTYTWCMMPSISTGTTKSAFGIG